MNSMTSTQAVVSTIVSHEKKKNVAPNHGQLYCVTLPCHYHAHLQDQRAVLESENIEIRGLINGFSYLISRLQDVLAQSTWMVHSNPTTLHSQIPSRTPHSSHRIHTPPYTG